MAIIDPAFTGIHSHFTHSVNLHRLPAGRKGSDGAVKQTRHAHGKGTAECPPGIQMATKKMEGKPFQQHGENGGGYRQKKPASLNLRN